VNIGCENTCSVEPSNSPLSQREYSVSSDGPGERPRPPSQAKKQKLPHVSASSTATASPIFLTTSPATAAQPYRGYSGASSSDSDEGSVGGTVTCSGVTVPGMNVMSTSSLGSPSSLRLRATRIVEPGSISRPST
jgi:hypothetical protein